MIIFDHVSKVYPNGTVGLDDVNLTIQDGEFVAIIGRSGAGKSTLLRSVNRMHQITSGTLTVNGTDVSTLSGKSLRRFRRGIGMVFQSYAVWPHMNVFDNVAYPLTIQKRSKEDIRKNVERVLDVVHLTQYAQRIPSQLSGGQQQRVALARALVAEPRLLLLDEPLSNLDAKLRESMRFEIKEIQSKLGITVVYVTHDQTEAMAMSDRIFVINGGVVQQVGHPEEIYRHPVNRFVADFVGKVDFLKGKASDGKVDLAGCGQTIAYQGEKRGEVVVAIRPENARMSRNPFQDMPCLKGRLTSCFYLGDVFDCRVDLGGISLRAISDAGSFEGIPVGEEVYIGVREFIVFDHTGEDELKILT